MIFENLFEEILPDIWPMVLFITIVVVILRIAYLLKHRTKFSIIKELLSLIFIIYILCLFQVVSFQDVNYGTSNFTPFKEILRYSIGSEKFIKNVVGNILLFVPFGFFISYYLKNKKVGINILITIIISSSIEIIQYYIGRIFDIDDIILNVCGGTIGHLIFVGGDKLTNKLPKLFKGENSVNILIILVIILIILYSFNINIFTLFD